MRQLFLQKGKIAVEDVNPPLLNEHHVLVRVHYSFISTGTENATINASGKSLATKFVQNATSNTAKILGAVKEHGFAGTLALTREKLNHIMPLGYSCAGQVLAVGSRVERFRVGDYVACAGASSAYHADMVSVPQNLTVKVKDPAHLKQASMVALGAIALQGVRRANLQLGEKICIIGMGILGQLSLLFAKQAGCQVIAIEVQEKRLTLAKKLGADLCLNPLSIDVTRELEFYTGHQGVDATIITASSASGGIIQQAMQATRRKGRVVLVGDVKIDFDREPFYSKEIDFLISCSYGPGRYDGAYEQQSVDYPYSYVRWTENRNMAYFVDQISNSASQLDALIWQEFEINNATAAYEALQKENILGVVLSYQKQGKNQQDLLMHKNDVQEQAFAKPYIHHHGKLNTSVIGVGGFAKVKILPTIAKIKNTAIHSIIDANTANAITIARVYKAQRISNDYHKILGDDDVKVVVIATPHSLHAQQAIDCLQAGKAVLVEKPAAVTFEQLAALKSFFAMNTKSLFCADFNRSCSPFMTAIKDVVSKRTNPLMISYRMNANYLPKGHWIQSDEHRGRIIGEACHIFELFCFLTDAKPISITVHPVNPCTEDLLITDNLFATISMSDGSSCSLMYTSLGHLGIGKEYMEIFFDGKTIAMNDFLELTSYGLPKNFDKKVKSQDKGHDQLFQQFFNAAQSKDAPNPIPLERILMATELSLVADRLARHGGGIEYFS